MKNYLLLVVFMSVLALPACVLGDLIAYCGYDYATGVLNGQASVSDYGLTGTWSTATNSTYINIEAGSLVFPSNTGFTSIGNRVTGGQHPTAAVTSSRALSPAARLDMDVDKDYYVSYLLKKTGTFYADINFTGGPVIISMGVTNNSPYRVAIGATFADSSTLYTAGTTVFIIAKISAKATGNDSISLKVYPSTGSVDLAEPATWDVTVSAPAAGTWTTLNVRGHKTYKFEIDEIRLGEQWSDVAFMPTEAFNPAPSDGSVAAVLNPTLSWDADSSAVSYDVYIGTDPNTLSSIASGLTDKYLTVSSLAVGTTYYWRVDLNFSGGASVIGNVWAFTTAGIATQPEPTDGSENNSVLPLLQWSGDFLMTCYDVYLGTSPGSLQYLGNVTDESFQITTALAENTTYYWRVDGHESCGTVLKTGQTWSFETGGLFGHWPLDEGSGTTALNAIAGGPNGAIVAPNNDYTRVAGVVGGALKLSPIDQANDNGPRIELTDIGAYAGINTNKATVTMWLWPEEPQQAVTSLFMNRGSATGFTTTNGLLGYLWNGANYAGTLALPTNKWVYVAWVIEPARATFYVVEDGVVYSAVSTSAQHAPYSFSGPTRIGAEVGIVRERFYRGVIDDVRIYNRPLAQSEVEQLFNNSRIAKYPTPANGAVNIPQTGTLQWTPGEGMTSQKVYLHTDPNLAGITPVITSGSSLAVNDLQGFTNYYWRVDTVTDSNEIAGNLWTFKTVPPKPYNPIAADNAVDVSPSQALSWEFPTSGYMYSVYLSTTMADVVNRMPAAFQATVSSPSFAPASLDWDTMYYWAIDVMDGAEVFAAGDLWRFTTINPVCNPPLAGDTNNDCVINLTDFSVMASNWLNCNLVPVEACP